MYHSVQKPASGMCSTADNLKIVYLHLLAPIGYFVDPDILKLAAKFGSKEFSVWVKPTKSFSKRSTLGQNGLKAQNGELFLRGRRLETVDLKVALARFYEFITSSPKAVLLVTRSSGIELMLLSEAIRKTNTRCMFERAIQRVVDTVPIFEKKLSILKDGSKLMLTALTSNMTSRGGNKLTILDTSFKLKLLEQSINENSISTSELIENSESYETFLRHPLFYNALGMADLIPILGYSIVINLRKANISFATLKELSQEDDPEILHRYVEMKCINKNVPINRKITLKIFNLLKIRRPIDHGDNSFNTRQERLVNEPGPSRTSHGEPYNNYSLLRQREELIDDPDSITEEMEAPYDSGHSCARQETQRTNYSSSTGDQETPSDILDLLMEGQGVRFDNDYPLSSGQEELAHAMNLHADELEATNDGIFPDQYYGPTMNRNSFVEEQETPYDVTYPFTSEEEERLADAISMIEEAGARGDNDHSLTRH